MNVKKCYLLALIMCIALGFSYAQVTSVMGLKNVMLDTDGDGLDDTDDIDADNDGILNVNEMECAGAVDLTTLSFNGSSISSITQNSITTSDVGWSSSYSNESLSLPITLKYTYSASQGYGMFGLIPDSGTQNAGSWNDDAYKFYMTSTSLYGKVPSGWEPYGITLSAGDVLEWAIDETGYVRGIQNGTIVVQFQGQQEDYNLVVTSYRAQIYTDITLSHSASQTCTARDTDGDNIPDHLDLDSDGDGCSDAFEAGATTDLTADFAFTSQAGSSSDTNSDGLADVLDSDLNGAPDFTNTYFTAALDAAVAECSDFDQDGIIDSIDLDDDNDGLYDTEEAQCSNGVTLDQLTFSGSAIGSVTSNSVTTANVGSWVSSYSNESLSLPILLEYTYTQATNAGMFGLIHEAGNQNTATWNDDAYKFYMTGNLLYGRANGSWNPYGISLSAGDILSWEVDENGYVTARQNGTTILEFQGVASDYYLAVTTNVGQTYSNVNLEHGASTSCQNVDTDNDSMPDHRDLDSDGDGCFDVAEAGFTDADNDGVLDGTGVSTTGLVTGNTDGYTGTNAQVVQSTVFGCEESVLFYQVNIDSDLTDANPGDGICADINGNCSLRAAIEEANSGSSLTEIGFLINGTIQLDSPLPTILKKMSINGTSAPGYAIGAPSIVISNPGNTIFNLSEADGTIIQGIDLSGAAGNFDVYGIVLAWCDDVVIKDNIIRNRTRAIHANNCCGLTVSRNDLRDAGRNSWDAAAYFINVCPGASETELYVAENQFGELNLNPQCAVQVLNASDIITSDGTVSGSNIVFNQALETSFPMRYVNVNGGSISNIDLSNQGAQEGIGLTLLNCSSIDVENVDIKNRHMGAHIIGGVGHSVKNCDFTDSGLNDDYAVVRLENISASSQADFAMEGNTMNDDVFTMFNFINCSGLSISTDAGVSPNILMGAQVIESHTAFRLQSSSSMSISGFDFKRDDQLIGTEGIIAELGSTSLTVSDCSFEGFASGINLADCSAADISCNTMVWNRNGIWVFGTSTVSALYQNSYHCNQVGIHNHTSTLVSSPNDYWGDPTGSQTDSGLGDHYEGLLDASTWLAAPPACAGPVNSNVCSPEDCDNGIDDDGDGLTDCEDRACNNHVGCDDNKSLTNDITGTPVSIINSIYPNPTDESSNIELNLDCDQLSIRDLSGRIVYHTENQKSGLLLVDVSAFNAGMYIIVATSGSQSEAHTIVVD